ncbi:MAG TPA: WYL domain-containing protein [Polyangiaceae bacterium]|nr:WYL domain-containing protein [Polyangiaceae bacterium]
MPVLPKPKVPRRGRPTGRFTQFRRLDRLRDVLESHPSGLALDQIAGMLHVTTRSVRRYLAELDRVTQLESVPTSPGGAHLWRIKPSERGRALVLRRTQAYGLLSSRRIFEMMRGSALYDELQLVTRQLILLAQRPSARAGFRGEIPSDQRLEDRLVYLPPPPHNYAQRGEELDGLFQAVADLRAITFRYRIKKDAAVEAVALHPFALVLHRGAIHSIGRVARGTPGEKDGVGVFAFHRMHDVTILEEHFALPDDFNVEDFIEGEFGIAASPRKTRVLVEFDAKIADEIRARKVHPTQRLATAPDGRVRLSMTVAHLDEVRRWILGFGPSARVLEPVELIDDIRTTLRTALERY